MHSTEVVMNKIQHEQVKVVVNLLSKGISQAGKPAVALADIQVHAFYIGRTFRQGRLIVFFLIPTHSPGEERTAVLSPTGLPYIFTIMA